MPCPGAGELHHEHGALTRRFEFPGAEKPSPNSPPNMALAPAYFANTLHGLYERHLLFDNGVDPAITNAREAL